LIYDKISGRSRGFAFVTMSSIEEAEAAAQQFNGYELDGRSLRVNSGPPPPRREDSFGSPRESSFRNSRDQSSFRGGREQSSFRGGREQSSFRGGREQSSVRGGREQSSFRSPRGDFGRGGSGGGDDANRLYVGNLSWGVDDRALETLFSESGRVVEAKVVYDRESGRSRGFGFVTLSSANEVNKAVDSLNGADLDGRSIRVSVAEAKTQRRSFREDY
jgi:RNA recognition motif-containing protein